MAPKRRRWLTALSLFLATALGGVLAYLLARRARRRRETELEKVSVAELSARLRSEAARRARPARGRSGRLHWPWSRRCRAAALSPRNREGQEAASAGRERGDAEDSAAGNDVVSGGLRAGRPGDAVSTDLAPGSEGGATHDREDPLAGT